MSAVPQAVPHDVALQLCAEIQQRGWYTLARWQCWGCRKFSKGDPAKMCGQIVACNLVTARDARQQKAT